MSSAQDFPASRSASQAKKRGLKTSVGYGRKPPEPFALFDQSISFWKMLRRLPHTQTHSGKFLVTFPTWGSMRNGVLYQHQNSEHSTSDEGLSFFPTPTANMGQKGINWAISLSEVVISRLPDFLARLDLKDGLPRLPNARANPLIVEWLMGFPLDYSKVGSEHWETLYIPRQLNTTQE